MMFSPSHSLKLVTILSGNIVRHISIVEHQFCDLLHFKITTENKERFPLQVQAIAYSFEL